MQDVSETGLQSLRLPHRCRSTSSVSRPETEHSRLFTVHVDDEVKAVGLKGILRNNTRWNWFVYTLSLKTLYIKKSLDCIMFR